MKGNHQVEEFPWGCDSEFPAKMRYPTLHQDGASDKARMQIPVNRDGEKVIL
jgi:hypothetical protein